jgi:hypothetical protein
VRASWSRHGDTDCLLVEGLPPGCSVVVRAENERVPITAPGMAGRYLRREDGTCFVPRFPFVEGTAYAVDVDGVRAATLTRPEPERRPVTEVVGIWPTAGEVPRNLLRLYVWFSSPMSEGFAADHIRLVGEDGSLLDHALFSLGTELWDGERRRLTVLLDPARIKRGLVPHRRLRYPLVEGQLFRFVVDSAFQDAAGRPLLAPGERTYRVGPDERGRVDPAAWRLGLPRPGTVEPLGAEFGRPLDHGLLGRCLHVQGPDGRPVPGRGEIGPEERAWWFQPDEEWSAGRHRLVVEPILEDVAGNSVCRVFDRDLDCPGDDPAATAPVGLELPIGRLW